MKLKATRKSLGTGALLFGLVLGGAGISAAATGNFPTQEKNDEPEQSFTSSVTAADGANLDGLAKISPEDAATAAIKVYGGASPKPILENEHGNVVYTVEVLTTSGKRVDVTVDAGNGKVLAEEPGDGEKNDGPDNNW